MAKLQKMQRDGSLKRAAIGMGTAAVAGAIALKAKDTALARRAVAVAMAGVTGTAAVLGGGIQHAKDLEKSVREKAKANVMLAKVHAQNQTAAAVEALRGVNVENMAMTGVDWAFQVPEALLAAQFAKRMANLEEAAAKGLGQVQAATAASVADKARAVHSSLLGKPGANEAAIHRASAELYKQNMEQLTQRKKLRSMAEWNRDKMLRAVNTGMRDMLKQGAMRFPTEDEIRKYLAQQNQDASDEKIREYMQWYQRMMFPAMHMVNL